MLNPKQLDLSKDIVMSGGNIYLSSGSASTPALLFKDHTNTGIYLVSNAKIGISTSGVQRLYVNTASVTSNLQVRSITGSASSPSYAFTNAINTGVFLDTSENTLNPSLSLSVGGNSAITLKSDLTIIADGNTAFKLPTGSTSQRPSSASAGMVRYNSDGNDIEYFDGTTWGEVKVSNRGVVNNLEIVTSDYTVQTTDYYIFANANTGNVTITLPSNVSAGTSYVIKRIDSSNNNVSILPSTSNSTLVEASDTLIDASNTLIDASSIIFDASSTNIDGSSTYSDSSIDTFSDSQGSITIDGLNSLDIKIQYNCYTLTTDGSNWFIV